MSWTSIFTSNVTLPQVFFTHVASKNQLPGFSIIGTLAGNGLTSGSMSKDLSEHEIECGDVCDIVQVRIVYHPRQDG